jgi:hypothetical protein
LLISQQVSKGFQDLGNKDAIMVRLGGIYGLEGVMSTSEQYHQPVLEALCAQGAGLVAHTLDEQRDINDAKQIFDDVTAVKTDPEMVQLAKQLIDRQRSSLEMTSSVSAVVGTLPMASSVTMRHCTV